MSVPGEPAKPSGSRKACYDALMQQVGLGILEDLEVNLPFVVKFVRRKARRRRSGFVSAVTSPILILADDVDGKAEVRVCQPLE